MNASQAFSYARRKLEQAGLGYQRLFPMAQFLRCRRGETGGGKGFRLRCDAGYSHHSCTRQSRRNLVRKTKARFWYRVRQRILGRRIILRAEWIPDREHFV